MLEQNDMIMISERNTSGSDKEELCYGRKDPANEEKRHGRPAADAGGLCGGDRCLCAGRVPDGTG